MDRDNLVKECDRLLNKLGELEPTSPEYETVRKQLIGASGKGGSKGLYDALIEMDTNAQDLLDKERSIELEQKKLDIEEMKVVLETMKFQDQCKHEARKLDLEEERIRNEKEEADRRLDVEEFKAVTEDEESKQRVHLTKKQAIWRLVEIGAGVTLQTIASVTCIKYIGHVQQFGIMDKTSVGFIPKIKLF